MSSLHSATDLIKGFLLLSTQTPLAPAWSLFHELLFYCVFSLFFFSRRLGFLAAGGWLGLTLLAAIGALRDRPSLSLWHLYFLAGAILVLLRFRIRLSPLQRRLCLASFWMPLTFVALYPGESLPAIGFGLTGVILLFLPLLEHRDMPESTYNSPWQRFGSGLGDISYSLYLGHFPVQTLLYHFMGPPGEIWKMALYVAAPITVALFLYKTLERPVTDYGRRLSGSF